MRAEKRRDAVRKNQKPQQKLDSSFHWNDEQKQRKNWMTSLWLLKAPPARD